MNAQVREFFQFLRNGKYTFPGCYPVFMITRDCETICYGCAKEEAWLIGRSTRDVSDKQWEFDSYHANWESELYCSHCYEQIEAAYSVVKEGEEEEQ